jgi:hypothetical protein
LGTLTEALGSLPRLFFASNVRASPAMCAACAASFSSEVISTMVTHPLYSYALSRSSSKPRKR